MKTKGDFMRYWIIVVVCLTFLVSCAATKSVMDSWMGHKESELVSTWGAPHRAMDTRDGKRILTWESRWGNHHQNVCRKSFTVNESGVIEHWSYSGCPDTI